MTRTVKQLCDRWDWKPIRNCPGRYVLLKPNPFLSISTLLGSDHQIHKFSTPLAKDKVLVVKLVDGGLITYSRCDGSLLHTLNTEEGFYRKLAQLEIAL